MRNLFDSHNRRKRGSVLPTAIILGVLSAIAATWMIGNLFDQQRLNERRRGIARAYFAAEAGVAQVIHWGNFPDTYDGLGEDGLFYRDMDVENTTVIQAFPNLLLALTDAGEAGIEIPSNKMSAFYSKYDENHPISSIESITLYPPAIGDPVSLFKVRSVGLTPAGRKRTVEAFMAANPLLTSEIALPAALISHNTATMGGNAHVHWGESWSRSDFTLPGPNSGNPKISNYLDNTHRDFDQWARYRSEGQILFDNWNPTQWIGSGTDYTKPLYGVTDSTRNYPGDPTVTTGVYSGQDVNSPDDDAFQHFLPAGSLPFPDFLSQYGEFKERARARGRYYTTDSSGNIYKDDQVINFSTEFGQRDLGDTTPYDLVFIDTYDQQPPRYPGTPEYELHGPNLATIRPPSGDRDHKAIKGVFYICANFDGTNASGASSLAGAEKPDETTENLSSMYMDGVLYTAGTLRMSGTTGVYGSVVTQMGFDGGGTPNIYYNHRLKDGLEMPKGNVGSIFKIVQQRNY